GLMLKTALGGFDKSTLLENIRNWLIARQGPRNEVRCSSATHMMIVVDDLEGIFPEFVNAGQNVQTRIAQIDENREQQVLEVYDLSLSLEDQLSEQRAYHIPAS